MMATCRIVLADDHVLVREAVKMLLKERDDFDVTGEADDGFALLHLLGQGPQPDAVIIDISMPRLGGIEAIREIRKISTSIKVLVLTMHKDECYLRQALSAGANGYLLKEDLAKELFIALDAVLGARVYISPVLARGET